MSFFLSLGLLDSAFPVTKLPVPDFQEPPILVTKKEITGSMRFEQSKYYIKNLVSNISKSMFIAREIWGLVAIMDEAAHL